MRPNCDFPILFFKMYHHIIFFDKALFFDKDVPSYYTIYCDKHTYSYAIIINKCSFDPKQLFLI